MLILAVKDRPLASFEGRFLLLKSSGLYGRPEVSEMDDEGYRGSTFNVTEEQALKLVSEFFASLRQESSSISQSA